MYEDFWRKNHIGNMYTLILTSQELGRFINTTGLIPVPYVKVKRKKNKPIEF